MKKTITTFLSLLFCFQFTSAQNNFEWSENRRLQLSDFQSESTQIGKGNLTSFMNGASINFGYTMSSSEFMTTKNFNSKVVAKFTPSGAYIMAPDTLSALQILRLAQYDFDLTELYTRKFRQEIYENKRAFSSRNFFQPLFDNIQKQITERRSKDFQKCEMGNKPEVLAIMQQELNAEIASLSDYCKECKPPKKKKQRDE